MTSPDDSSQTPTSSTPPAGARGHDASSAKAAPTLRWMFGHPARVLAFGFGAGLLRPGPGTWGTLAAWLLWVLARADAAPAWAVGLFLLAALALGAAGCHRTGRDLGVPDHGGMVWDEMVAFWLVLWLIPGTLPAQVLAFALFRLFDIAKPPPVRQFDARWKNGFGVMWDDLLAAGYTLLAMAVLVRLGVLP
jgi:Phosphatidylglycerophosphatase A and related proteins